MANIPAEDATSSADASPALSSIASTVLPASPPSSPPRSTMANPSNNDDMDTKPAATTSTTKKATPSPPRSSTAAAPSSSPLRLAHSFPPAKTSPAATNSNASPSKQSPSAASNTRSPTHAPTRTAQMLVLGRDGSDYRDIHRAPTRNHPAKTDKQISLLTNIMSADEEHNTPADNDAYQLHEGNNSNSQLNDGERAPKRSSWWRGFWGAPKEKKAASDDLEENRPLPNVFPQQQRQVSSFHISMGSFDSSGGVLTPNNNGRNNNHTNREATIYYQDGNEDDDEPDNEQGRFVYQHRSPPRQSLQGQHASLLATRTVKTAEDQLQSECSFFYRPVEDEPVSPRHSQRGVLRCIVASPNLAVSTRYRDAEDVLAPPEIAQYQAKYQQLNREDEQRFRRSSKDRDDSYSYDPLPPGQNDLFLDEDVDEEGRQNAHSLVTNTVSQSTLFYRDNGRVVLRLPRDHVRLIMDPHLEPGILSVVQRRRPGEAPSKRLEYCLTVPTDLYQSVISEMTHYSAFITGDGGGGGLDSSFYASDHLDIRVAIGVIAVTLLILGIITVVFHLN